MSFYPLFAIEVITLEEDKDYDVTVTGNTSKWWVGVGVVGDTKETINFFARNAYKFVITPSPTTRTCSLPQTTHRCIFIWRM